MCMVAQQVGSVKQAELEPGLLTAFRPWALVGDQVQS